MISVASPAHQNPRRPEVTRRCCLEVSCLSVICASGSFSTQSSIETWPILYSPLEDGFGWQRTPTGQAILEIHGLLWRSVKRVGHIPESNRIRLP